MDERADQADHPIVALLHRCDIGISSAAADAADQLAVALMEDRQIVVLVDQCDWHHKRHSIHNFDSGDTVAGYLLAPAAVVRLSPPVLAAVS